MIPLDEYFEIKVDKTKMKATIINKVKLDNEVKITVADLMNFIKEHGIVYGVKTDLLPKIASGEITVSTIIAEGKAPVKGEDAFLRPIFPNMTEVKNINDLMKVDLKQVLNIPSVKVGQLIGEKVQATSGVPGTNIFGEVIKPKIGRDLKLRVGKNTKIGEDGLKIYATIDGQMSVEPKVIHVHPVFEVNGDLDLKVGNISFIGCVNIRGNVPAGFEIRSKGDIKIHGTVESATLISEGSIFVSAGIVGQGKGLIKAKGDLHTSFINQSIVDVDGDINVVQSILHSNVKAGGSIYCNKGKGNIVGGSISACKEIVLKEVGNAHNTSTSLFLGINQELLNKEKLYRENLKKAEEDLRKLNVLLNTLTAKEKATGLSANEKIMKLRVRNTINVAINTLNEAKEKLEDFEELFTQFGSSMLKVEQKIYPNVDVHFGKYRRKIISAHQYVKIYLEDGEIHISPL